MSRCSQRFAVVASILCVLAALCGCVPAAHQDADSVTAGSRSGSTSVAVPAVTDYAQVSNWAYLETDAAATDADVDVFFVCPSTFEGTDDTFNMPLSDEQAKERFLGAVNMEKGIYDPDGAAGGNRFFAPFYQQIGFNVYEMPEEGREPYLKIAYADVRAAFEYFCAHYNDGRPIVLAGFSQGADLCIRLMKDCFDDPALQDRLVACYAIGWRVTEEEVEKFPQLKMAQGERDTGVIVSFNSESPATTGSLLVPAGTKTLAINPLNWKTDGTFADKALNEGACFTDRTGAIVEEVPRLTGAYIDEERGTLKVPDVSPDDYTPGLSLFEPGVFHRFDFQFFYRNLQKNVKDRTAAFFSER